MDSQQVFTFGQQGLYLLLMVSEATLSFVPKIVAAVAVLAIAGPWMLTTLVEYIQRTLQAIPTVVG